MSLVALVVVVGGVFVLLRPDPVVTDGKNTTVVLASMQFDVEDGEPFMENPDQFLGIAGTPPSFDTSPLGPDLTFELRSTDELAPLERTKTLRSIYLGHDVHGDPYYVWHKGSRNFIQFLGQIVADFGAVGRFMTSYGTERTGPGLFDDPPPPSFGVREGSLRFQTGQPVQLVAEWHSLPDEVSVVVFYNGETPLGWQTPVSGTVAIHSEMTFADMDTKETSMVALDVNGNVLETLILFPAQSGDSDDSLD